mmetsp:Transcript_8489/g.13088  ORF Transcript_8489/g.13088 Transcript_8489/m.13088 type:complete len:539 (-) Transcript_8489:113-1729(-)
MFSKSDPFFEVSKLVNTAGGPTWQVAYRSEVIKNDLNPKWKSVSMPLSHICGDNKDERVMITVKDWEKSGKHTPMGTVETSVNGMINQRKTGASFELKKKGKSFGTINVISAKVEGETVKASSTRSTDKVPDVPPAIAPVPVPIPTAPPASVIASPSRPSFLDYLSGGLELQLSVAIDFTGSNGDPRKPGTLHYINRHNGQLNSYEKALSSVGSIIARYDHDQRFQMLGFGAKYNGVVQHCFQVGPTAEVSGVKGMVDAYRYTFKSGLVMSGPTVFEDVITLAASQARAKQKNGKGQAYQVLLILTDGAVSNIAQTKRTLATASDAPMSIVIVGMGNADFSSMQFLDDFAQQEGLRDICQFVDFNRHQHNKMDLTQATLDEIPDQVVEYFYSSGIMPLPAVHGSQLNLVVDDCDDEEIQLDFNFNDDGEISLGSGGIYDETSFGNYNTVSGGIAPSAPPAQQAYQPSVAQPSKPYSIQQPVPVQAHAPQQQQQVILVQVPPGAIPGQQLQLLHPQSGQAMLVAIPPGTAPGNTFTVAC